MRPSAELLDAVEILRRLSNVARYAEVAEADLERGRVRVAWAQGPDGDPVNSAWLPWLSAMAGEDRAWRPPSIGERVALICPDGEIASGFVLAGFASSAFPAPDSSPAKDARLYRDGARIEYDAETHVLAAVLPAGGSASIEAPEGVTIDGDVTIEGAVGITGDVTIDGTAGATGNISSDGDLSAGGGVSDPKGSMEEMRGVYNGHTHVIPGTPPVTAPATTQKMT